MDYSWMNTRETVVQLIHQAKNELNYALSRHFSIVSEEVEDYVYPSDLSSRLTKLQKIVGQLGQSSKMPRPLSLWNLIEEAHVSSKKAEWVYIRPFILQELITKLRDVLLPIKDFPPIKRKLKWSIEIAIQKLSHAAILLLEEEQLKKKKEEKKTDTMVMLQTSSSLLAVAPLAFFPPVVEKKVEKTKSRECNCLVM